MRILTKTKANKDYCWHANFVNVTIEARLINNKVFFYEVRFIENLTKDKCLTDIPLRKECKLSEDLVKSLFRPGTPLKDQPFLVRDNRDFFTILHRNRKRFNDKYYELKNKKHD